MLTGEKSLADRVRRVAGCGDNEALALWESVITRHDARSINLLLHVAKAAYERIHSDICSGKRCCDECSNLATTIAMIEKQP